jgi:hypothetical protein
MEFADGDFCARPATACGTVSPIQLDFTPTAIEAVGAAVMADPPQQTACQVPNKSWFCGAMTSKKAAEVECVSLHYGYSITNSSCDASSDLGNFECILGGECINWSSGGACGFLVHACVAYCETEEGQLISGACDDGQTCGIPEASVGYLIIEGDDTPTACTNVGSDVDCDSVNGFSCVEFFDGNYCARKRKVCGIDGVTAD